jgi:hypothetical protein
MGQVSARSGVLSLGLLLGAIPAAVAAPAVDQEQPIIDDTIGGAAIGGGSLSDEYLAQTFTVGMAGKLVEVRLPIGCDPNSDLILQIQNVDPLTGEGKRIVKEYVETSQPS